MFTPDPVNLQPRELLQIAADFFESRGIAYRVVGSMASIAYGENRFTNDVDVVADLQPEHVDDLCAHFQCLTKEFTLRGIPFVPQPELKLSYKQQPLMQTYKPDFVCFDKIIVELKAVKAITPEHQAQVLNYLKATGYRLGLLVNFGDYPKATIERLAL